MCNAGNKRVSKVEESEGVRARALGLAYQVLPQCVVGDGAGQEVGKGLHDRRRGVRHRRGHFAQAQPRRGGRRRGDGVARPQVGDAGHDPPADFLLRAVGFLGARGPEGQERADDRQRVHEVGRVGSDQA